MTDEVLIARILDGDPEAFRAIVEQYQGPVLRVIANLIHDRHTCEDIAQEVFLAAFRSLRSFDPARSAFSTWLFTIARHKSINAGQKRRHAASDRHWDRRDSRHPSDSMAEQEFYEMLDRGLEALPQDQRTAFVLAEFEELPYEKIAQIEGVRVGTVRSRINRAKAKLRGLLNGQVGDA